MSENNEGPPDPARDAVAQLLRSALRGNMDVPRNREVVQEYMDRLLNGDPPNTEPAGPEAPPSDTNTAAAASDAPAPATPTPGTQPPRAHRTRDTPIMLVTYSLGTTHGPPTGAADNTIWNLATEASRQAREARGRAREERGTQAYRSRSQSQRPGLNRRRERSPMRTRVGEAEERAAQEGSPPPGVEPAAEAQGPNNVHLNHGWFSSPLIQRLLHAQRRGGEGEEAGTEAGGEDGIGIEADGNIRFSPGEIDYRPDGTTTATFTIPTHMFAGGVLGGPRNKPKASRRVIRSLETLELSEVTGQTCPICYDAFDAKPLGWDAIMEKLAENERAQEPPAPPAAPTASTDLDDMAPVNPSESVHGPVQHEIATISELAIQAVADEIVRARDTGTEEDFTAAMTEAGRLRRYVVDTPEDAAAFREANPRHLSPIIRVDPEAGPRVPFTLARVPAELRREHERTEIARVNQLVRERQQRTQEAREAPPTAPATAESQASGAETAGETGATSSAETDAEAETRFPESHVATKMPCGHVFGHLCICEWLKSNNSCPLCRTTVESESEYLQSIGQAEESRAGGFFDVLFNVLPRVFQEIEADRRRHTAAAAAGAPAPAPGGDIPPEMVGPGTPATTADTSAGTTDGPTPTAAPQEGASQFLGRGLEGWPQLVFPRRVVPTMTTDTPPQLPPVADIFREFHRVSRPQPPAASTSSTAGGTAPGAAGETAGETGTETTPPAAHNHPHVHQPIPGVFVYHRPSDFFRLHGDAGGPRQEVNRVSGSGVGNVGAAAASVGQETLQAVGTDGGDANTNNGSDGNSSATNVAPSSGEGLRSRLVEPLRRMFRSRENDRHHPYRRPPPPGGSGSGSEPREGN